MNIMDYFKKKFSFLLIFFGKKGTQFPYLIRKKDMEINYHLYPFFFHFFFTFSEDLKISLYQNLKIFLHFKRLLIIIN
jgi:hypothetical protein